MPVFFVPCAKTKASHRCAAKDLYISRGFRRMRQYVELHKGSPWYILSAKHGLLHPDRVIDPYEQTLNGKPRRYRENWAWIVGRQLLRELSGFDRLDTAVVLAGESYREFLMQYISRDFLAYKIPMQGLSQGRQYKWLGDRIAEMQR